MPRQVFSFDQPDRFVAGTVGQPGQRTFFLQATDGERVTSVALEKTQVQVLAERLADLLDEVRRRGADAPVEAPPGLEDVAPLDQPILEEFRAGTLAIAWDGEDGMVVVEAHEMTDAQDAEDDDETAEGDLLRVRITPAFARAFVKRALRVVAAGRPPCPLCGRPLDPEGHVCARLNGHGH
ncbi:MAG TPA: DUF3090 domain-containing protein [Mycobacteriales bacterium]|jgi:uncharacterized repeat protein (TIGR03847 family)|nr:DUF3090 domain-containing protein [Mycobacteriales bacterium]